MVPMAYAAPFDTGTGLAPTGLLRPIQAPYNYSHSVFHSSQRHHKADKMHAVLDISLPYIKQKKLIGSYVLFLHPHSD